MQINNTSVQFKGTHIEKPAQGIDSENIFTNDKVILDELTKKLTKGKLTNPSNNYTSDRISLSCMLNDKVEIVGTKARTAKDPNNKITVNYTDALKTKHTLIFDITTKSTKEYQKLVRDFLDSLQTSVDAARKKIQDNINSRVYKSIKNI